ncbi:MAG TPA: hypothetical protein EYQ54_09580 [Myxococcales bacterium]|nr:hypothetical protein [Myxococcales bacterium]
MIRFPALVALLALSFSSLALASEDFSFHEFAQADPLPASMVGAPIEDSEIELDRIFHGIVIEAETSGLTPHYAYTVWALVFNDPAACEDGCDLHDMGADGFAALWTGVGVVANEDGEADFESVMFEDEPAGEILMGPGLVDARRAEIHLIVRSHGPAAFGDSAVLNDQLTTFGGGCEISACEDVQYATLKTQRRLVAAKRDRASFQDFTPATLGEIIPNSKIKLKRKNRKLRLSGETTNLEAGHAYTIWAVIFNRPQDCVGGCNADDLNLPSSSVIWSGIGFVADEDGEASFKTGLKEGSFPGEILLGIGLTDAAAAEILLVVRGHGPAAIHDPGMLEAQTSTFMGGCETNECVDVQFAVVGQAMEPVDDD